MIENRLAAFSLCLREIASPTTYARGEAYHRERRVDLLSITSERVLAGVRGSEAYRVELWPATGGQPGRCDCPAFEDMPVCKHMVAVALTALDAGGADAGPSKDRLGEVRTYLLGRSVEALATWILRLAEQNIPVLDALEQEMADATEDDDTLTARYARIIDGATDTGASAIDYYAAGAFAEDILAVIELLERLADGGRVRPARVLAERLLDGLDEVFQAVDDSNGEVGGAVDRACALHQALCHRSPGDPVALADWLFEHETASEWPAYEDAWATYAEVLGETGLTEYRRLAGAAWAAMRPGGDHDDLSRYAVRSILDGFARRDGDVEARIALRKVDLKKPGAYLEIADICREAGQAGEALRWLEEALWCFEDRPDERLERAAAGLMAAAGRGGEAERILWRVFERSPSLAAYRELAALTSEASPEGRATAILESAAERAHRPGPHFNVPAQTLFDLQMAAEAHDAAWRTATRWGVGEHRLRSLADRTCETHRDRAVHTYEFLAESRIVAGGAGNYDDAIKLLGLRAHACADAANQAAYLDGLRLRHKAKRTFVQRLQTLG